MINSYRFLFFSLSLYSAAPSPLTHACASFLRFGLLLCLCAIDADYCRCINILYTYFIIYLDIYLFICLFIDLSI